MKHLRLTPEQLADIEKRIKANATVRVHRCLDDNDHNSPKAPKVQKPPKWPGKRERAKAFRPLKRIQLSERQVLRACLNTLSVHPKVAWAARMNTGMFKNPSGQPVKFGFTGCADILGMLKGGRLLACEVKGTGKTSTTAQAAFLKAVNAAGGLGLCVDDSALLAQALEAA